MKILAFVDTHGLKKAHETIRKKAEKADLLICPGDVSIFAQNLREHLEFFEKIGKPIVILHGNHETEDEMKKGLKGLNNFIYLHGNAMEVEDYIFLGYGGGGFSKKDSGFEEFAKSFGPRIKGKKVVLITHGPPYGTRLDKLHGEYVGCKSYTKFIEKHSPMIALSGHLHENADKEDKIGITKVINPGPFGRMIDL